MAAAETSKKAKYETFCAKRRFHELNGDELQCDEHYLGDTRAAKRGRQTDDSTGDAMEIEPMMSQFPTITPAIPTASSSLQDSTQSPSAVFSPHPAAVNLATQPMSVRPSSVAQNGMLQSITPELTASTMEKLSSAIRSLCRNAIKQGMPEPFLQKQAFHTGAATKLEKLAFTKAQNDACHYKRVVGQELEKLEAADTKAFMKMVEHGGELEGLVDEHGNFGDDSEDEESDGEL
ncbi:hypothetical protein BDV96DRAFT_580947 [Lophiotrema nucula]|uniref:Uncharacterized protein n=1 Tax=Lophiotrema nucula TaxID=690887 RepID=A0A6A5YYT9_9PLEO|nr:hypothetical protein BDV96DRAFT_580947 [Lophiotrema nucula]